MNNSGKLRQQVVSYFEINGYCLRNDAVKYLCGELQDVGAEERPEWFERITDSLQRQPLISSVITEALLRDALKDCCEAGTQDVEFFSVINAFTVPCFYYSLEKKKYVSSAYDPSNANEGSTTSTALHSGAESKWRLFLERYKLIQQRTSRHHLFAPSIIKGQAFNLKPVEYLLGSSGLQTKVIVLGMLTQLQQGIYSLEDPTGIVRLNLSNVVFKSGLFTENSFVIVEGSYEDGIMEASAIGFTPPETSQVSMQNLGNTNFFGGASSTSLRHSEKLRLLEEKNSDAVIVFLSDVWLDQMKVLEKLKTLFAGYSESPPTAFVFLGNFMSTHKAKSNGKALKEALKAFGKMICEFGDFMRRTRFIFVPGPEDPGLSTILPRPEIPNCIVNDFLSQVPTATFTSNPCRIQFCTQEIVIFREDLMSKMCRNTINSPWQTEENVDIPGLLAKSLVANGHLCPLPITVSPVYWDFDHALRLYPLPDLVVIGDKCDPYRVTNTGTTFINPGSFPRTDFSFKVYIPATRDIEESQIVDNV